MEYGRRAERGLKVFPTGPIQSRTRVAIRVDEEVLDWFLAQAQSQSSEEQHYEALMNYALRRYMADCKRQPET